MKDFKNTFRRCLEKSPGAWQKLIEFYGPTIYGILKHRKIPEDHIEDLYQEVWMSLFADDCRRLKVYNPQFSFVTYLKILTRSVISKHYKKKWPQPLDEFFDIVDPKSLKNEDNWDEILEILSPVERLCLRLKFWQGLTQKEISERLGLPQGTVGSHISRSINKLQKNKKNFEDLQ